MKTYRAWSALACLALAVGCSKSEPAGGSAGTAVKASGAAAAPAAAPADKADAYMQGIVDAVGRGDAATMWNALPPKYQADVTSLKNEFAAKMDPDLWNKAFVVAGKLTTLLKDKKAMILASPLGAQVPPPIKIMAEANWDTVAGSLNTVVNSEIKTLEGLKSAEPGKFLSSTGTTVVTSVMKTLESTAPEAAAGMAKVRKSKVVLVKQEGDVAVLKLEVEGEPKAEEKTFRKIDGKWLPAEMVDSWDATMTNAKTELAGLTITPEMKAQFNGAVGMVEPILDKLIAAKDQAAFDGEVQGLMAIAAMFGGGPPGGSMQGPPGGAPSGLPSPSGLPPAGLPGGLPPAGGPGGLPTTTPPPSGLPPLTPPAGLPSLPPSTTPVAPPTTTPPTTVPPTTVPPTTTPAPATKP
jgi:hypothetical protein